MVTEMRIMLGYIVNQHKFKYVITMIYSIVRAEKFNFMFLPNSLFLLKKVAVVAALLAMLLITSGCGGSSDKAQIKQVDQVVVVVDDNTPSDLSLMQSAKTKWDNLSGQFYSIQSQRVCLCVPEMSSQMEVSVSNNLVLSAFDIANEEAISKEIQQEITTVDGLFALIEKAIADGVSIEVTYNEEYGYPELAKIDLEKIAVDGGLHIILSNLEIKDSLLALGKVTWRLESFDSIAGPQPTIEGSATTLSFDMENMQVNGSSGCNRFSGEVVVDEKNNLSISNIVSTEMACSEPENIMQQEYSYLATLAQVQFYSFDMASLNMVVGGDSGLHFVAEHHASEVPKIDGSSNDLGLLQAAKKQWNSVSGQHYSIQSQRICECQDEVSAEMEVSVLGGVVLSAVDIVSGNQISEEIQQEIMTVDGLFALIEKALADDITIEVIYHADYGYPESLKIDLEQIPVDGGLYIILSNFVTKDSVSALDEVTWSLESFDSIAGPQPIIDSTSISLSFDMVNLQLSGSGGCNHFNADFVLDKKNHDITITNLTSDAAVCSEPENIMQQEQNFFSTLGNIRFLTFNEASLSLSVGGDAGLHFVVAD